MQLDDMNPEEYAEAVAHRQSDEQWEHLEAAMRIPHELLPRGKALIARVDNLARSLKELEAKVLAGDYETWGAPESAAVETLKQRKLWVDWGGPTSLGRAVSRARRRLGYSH